MTDRASLRVHLLAIAAVLLFAFRIEAAVSISKAFSPGTVSVGGTSTLTFTITNTDPGIAATGVAFVDPFPAGLSVAASPNASFTGCGSPTFAPAGGNTSVSFSGGTIAASGTCAVTVDVTPATGGSKVNTTGNVTSTNGGTGNTASATLTVPVAPPIVITPANGSQTNDNTPVVTGSAEPGRTISVYVDAMPTGTTTSDASGNWSFVLTPLAEGSHTVYATANDGGGSVSGSSNANTFIVDTVPPAAPVVLTPANGSTTNDNTPTYSGTAEPSSTVTVIVDGSPAGSTTSSGAGNWALTPVAPLADGVHTVRSTSADAGGNVSPNSNTNTFTVDTLPPAAPVVIAPANGSTTNDNTPAYSGTAQATSTVTVTVDGSSVGTTTANGAGNWSFTPVTPLADGLHSVRATAADGVGNTSPTSNTNTFNVDTTGPPAPVVLTPANGSTTSDNTPAYSGSSEAGSTVTVIVDGSAIGTTTANGSGNWSLTPPAALADGPHTVRAIAADAVGNVSPNSNTNTFTIDTLPPAAPVVIAPANGLTTSDNTPAYSGTAEPSSTVTVNVDGSPAGSTTADGAGNWSFTPAGALADGPHTVRATATDAGGNVSPNSNTNTFTVDTLPPAAPVVIAPANGSTTNDNTPAYSGTAQATSTVTVTVDGSSIGTTTADGAGNWSFTPVTPLADGLHSVRATAADGVGNTSPTSNTNTFNVDTTGPPAPVVVTPANGATTSDNTPAYSGTAEPSTTVTVIVDGSTAGTTGADGSGNWVFAPVAPLADGAHTVRARAMDASANVSPDSNTNTFTVDTTAPAAPVVIAPANGSTTNDNTPAYSGTAEPSSTITVLVDGASVGTATADGAGNWSLTPAGALADGSHAVRATSTDAVGNTSVSSTTNTFTVDTTAPAAPVVLTPVNGSTTNDNTPVYSGSAVAGSTVNVIVDGANAGTTTADGAGNWSLTPAGALADGSHAVRATSSDAVGNVSADSNTNTFTVDTTAPAAPVVVTPANGSTTTSPITISGTAEPGATIDVDIDGMIVSATADGTGAWSLVSPPLAPGAHSLSAIARDGAGNGSASSATVAFIVIATASTATSEITATPGTTTVNGAPVTITVQLRDAGGSNLTSTGGLVTIATTLGTLSTVIDHGDGTYTATLTPGAVAGMATVTATLNGVPLTDTATVQIADAAAIPTLSEWSLLLLALALGAAAMVRFRA